MDKPGKGKMQGMISSAIVILLGLYAIMPMIILGGKYMFAVHDNLDHHAAMIQYIHDENLFFSFFEEFPIMGGIPGYYFLSYLSFGLSGVLEWLLGYFNSQIAIRIIGVMLGYVSMRFLAGQLYREQTQGQINLVKIISILYAITPVSLIRTLSFAVLPLIAGTFLYLQRHRRFTKKAFLCFFFPFLSYFNSLTLFALGFWSIGLAGNWIKNRKINRNLLAALGTYAAGTFLSDLPLFLLVLHSSETNRGLHSPVSQFDTGEFLGAVLFGQYHAMSYHHYILMWCVVCSLVFFMIKYVKEKEQSQGKICMVLAAGILLWLAAAFMQAYQETNHRTGILLIDGFQWGRIIGWGRFLWIVMFMVAGFFGIKQERGRVKSGSFYIKRLLLAAMVLACMYLTLKRIFGTAGFPNQWSSFLSDANKNFLNALRWTAIGLFSIGLFIESRKLTYMGISAALAVHGAFVITSNDLYTDTTRSLVYNYRDIKDDRSINFEEFFSKELFENIKDEINYAGEGVAAYGFHPSVLLYNGFHTIDGYLSVHPMRNQTEFRKIIAPYLERDSYYQSYYDDWGGRMYLFGELGVTPTRNKEVEPSPLYMDTSAFKEYGGSYLFSRAQISNASELGLRLVDDFDCQESIYHIYLYSAYD